MTIQRDEILQQALPPADRLFAAAALEDILPDEILPSDGISGDELLRELQRRSASYRADKSMARPADEVLADLKRLRS